MRTVGDRIRASFGQATVEGHDKVAQNYLGLDMTMDCSCSSRSLFEDRDHGRLDLVVAELPVREPW